MADIEHRLNAVEEIIKKPSFRENKGLSNEVGYYVFDYPADQELAVRDRIKKSQRNMRRALMASSL